jgi:hypothetical protein
VAETQGIVGGYAASGTARALATTQVTFPNAGPAEGSGLTTYSRCRGSIEGLDVGIGETKLRRSVDPLNEMGREPLSLSRFLKRHRESEVGAAAATYVRADYLARRPTLRERTLRSTYRSDLRTTQLLVDPRFGLSRTPPVVLLGATRNDRLRGLGASIGETPDRPPGEKDQTRGDGEKRKSDQPPPDSVPPEEISAIGNSEGRYPPRRVSHLG